MQQVAAPIRPGVENRLIPIKRTPHETINVP